MYVPILRGRDGEFQALQHLSSPEIHNVRPILEVPSGGKGIAADVDQFVHRARRRLPFGLRIGVDWHQVNSGDDESIDAVREICKDDPDAKVLMCSAMGQQALVVEAIQAGAKDFVVKPFQPSRVLEAVQRVLG